MCALSSSYSGFVTGLVSESKAGVVFSSSLMKHNAGLGKTLDVSVSPSMELE